MLSPAVSAKIIRMPIKHLPQTTAVTTGSAVELVLTSRHQPGQSSAFHYFFVSRFPMLVCSLCHSFHWLLVLGSIWTAKWSFAPSFAKSAGCGGMRDRYCSRWIQTAQCSRGFSSPFPAWVFFFLCLCGVFFKEIWSWLTSGFRNTIQAPGTGQSNRCGRIPKQKAKIIKF